MASQQPISSFWKWPVILLSVIVVVMLIRNYCISSYRISTDAMENALHTGDRILVNKLPLEGNPGRNRVVLFQSPLRKDADSRPLFVSRCIGMPGDTIQISQEGYKVNGQPIPRSPLSLNTFYIRRSGKEVLDQIMQDLEFPLKKMIQVPFGYTFVLTTFEEYLLREELPEDFGLTLVDDHSYSYSLIVPRKGEPYRLDDASLIASREAIITETMGTAEFRNGKLFLEGKEVSHFIFQNDYYWVLSDNAKEAVDSRHLGFVPEDLIVGNAFFCWYSKDKRNLFKHIQ